jgi:hypothetical protein
MIKAQGELVCDRRRSTGGRGGLAAECTKAKTYCEASEQPEVNHRNQDAGDA